MLGPAHNSVSWQFHSKTGQRAVIFLAWLESMILLAWVRGQLKPLIGPHRLSFLDFAPCLENGQLKRGRLLVWRAALCLLSGSRLAHCCSCCAGTEECEVPGARRSSSSSRSEVSDFAGAVPMTSCFWGELFQVLHGVRTMHWCPNTGAESLF